MCKNLYMYMPSPCYFASNMQKSITCIYNNKNRKRYDILAETVQAHIKHCVLRSLTLLILNITDLIPTNSTHVKTKQLKKFFSLITVT